MKRLFIPLVLVVVVIAILVALVLSWRKSGSSSSLPQTTRNPLAGIESFAKDHFTGGIGVVLMVDTNVHLPQIISVLPGSPAEKAGLCASDCILQVNDWSTTNQPLAKVVENLRGLTTTRAKVTIQRADTSNLVVDLNRASWSSLGISITSNTAPTMPANTNTLVR